MLSSGYPVQQPLGRPFTIHVGSVSRNLTLVGIANSIDGSADGWVLPSEIA